MYTHLIYKVNKLFSVTSQNFSFGLHHDLAARARKDQRYLWISEVMRVFHNLMSNDADLPCVSKMLWNNQ